MENPFLTQNNTPKASSMLKTLCVLTFIGSGFSFIANFYYAAFFETAYANIEEMMDSDLFDGMSSMFENTLDMMTKAGLIYYLINAVLYAVSITGAALMWNLKKIGLHLYIGAQLILLLIPTLFGLVKYPSIFGLIVTLFFISFYFMELRRILSTQQPQE